jgi:hypothetical protein
LIEAIFSAISHTPLFTWASVVMLFISLLVKRLPLRFEKHLEVDYNDLLIPHREEDYKDDLYTVLNIIQENLIRGNVSGVNKESGRRFKSKEIKSITTDAQVNKGVWEIAEKIASIKDDSYESTLIAA